MKSLLTFLMLMLLFVAEVAHAQDLRTLFSTPQQRAELDRLREQWIQGLTEAQQVAVDEMAPEPAIVNLGGVVMRSNQSFVVWLNGLPVDEEDLPENMKLRRDGGQVSLVAIVDGIGDVVVKPGQSVNLNTGETRESYDLTQEQIDAVRGVEALRQVQRQIRSLPVEEEEDSEETDGEADGNPASAIMNVLDALQEARRLQESLQ